LWYYGDGKGKTTAAIGLAVRAKGAQLRVGVFQFMKSEKWQSYERKVLGDLDIPVKVMGGGFVGIIDDAHPIDWHREKATEALTQTQVALMSMNFDVVIADEIGTAIDEGLLTVKQVADFIKVKPAMVHLVMTGHTNYAKIEVLCDLVTRMKNIKHPFHTEGLLAQRGIDF